MRAYTAMLTFRLAVSFLFRLSCFVQHAFSLFLPLPSLCRTISYYLGSSGSSFAHTHFPLLFMSKYAAVLTFELAVCSSFAYLPSFSMLSLFLSPLCFRFFLPLPSRIFGSFRAHSLHFHSSVYGDSHIWAHSINFLVFLCSSSFVPHPFSLFLSSMFSFFLCPLFAELSRAHEAFQAQNACHYRVTAEHTDDWRADSRWVSQRFSLPLCTTFFSGPSLYPHQFLLYSCAHS